MHRRGKSFWPQYAAAVVLTVVFGAAIAVVAAGALDGAFGRLLDDVLGPGDASVLIVHVRADDADAAARRLRPLLASWEAGIEGDRGGVAEVRRTVTVAGNANFVITLGDPLPPGPGLERLPSVLQPLPGFNGYTWLLEPSVTVSGAEPGVRDAAAKAAAELDGVVAVVRHGSRATVVVADEDARADVARRLQRWLDDRRVLRVAAPDGALSEGGAARLRTELEQRVGQQPVVGWEVLGGPDTADGSSPAEMAAAALANLPDAWAWVAEAGAGAQEAMMQLVELMDELEPLLTAAEHPGAQAERLAGFLREGDGTAAVKDVLLQVAFSTLWRSLTEGNSAAAKAGGGTAAPSGPGSEEGWAERWRRVRDALAEAAAGAGDLAAITPEDAQNLNQAMELIEQFLPSSPAANGTVSLLVPKSVSLSDVEAALAGQFSGGEGGLPTVSASAGAPGAVEPSPRAVAAGLLADVRRAVAGVFALLAASGALVLEHTVVFAAWPRLSSGGRGDRLRAALVGAVLFAGTYGLAGGAMPLPGRTAAGPEIGELAIIAALGALVGVAAYRWAPLLSPVDEGELLAGRSLGLDDDQLLQELVVPRGRPGLLILLNRARQTFP